MPQKLPLAWSWVVMAKPVVPGKVKTRLIPVLGAQNAALVHEAMLHCILRRLSQTIDWAVESLVLAYDSALTVDNTELASQLACQELGSFGPVRFIEQGPGNLGERMLRVWEQLQGGPVIFLGADSPDIPPSLLRDIPALLEVPRETECPPAVGVGAVDDGGYWTLAATELIGQVLTGIDWGSSKVYHQTCEAVVRAGAKLVALDSWYDIDDVCDLQGLQERLKGATEPALVSLGDRLHAICDSKKD